MKKRILAVLLILVLVLGMAIGLVACNDTPDNGEDEVPDLSALNGTYDFKVWVSEVDGVADLTAAQIDAFEALHPGITINATIEGVTEGDSASQMITDVETGADLYCFAQDQLARLVQAGALAELGVNASATVEESHDAGAVNAAKVGGKLYSYPLTSDNGYFMYYDKRYISEDDVDSLEKLVAACEAAGKNFSFELEGSAWYTASFFFATGAHSNWTTDPATGEFIEVDDTFNSANGLIAMKGMEKLTKSTSFMNSSNGADFAAATPSAVVVSGTWALTAVQDALGENMGVADLPSFTVDGQTYHLGSFSGNKLMGVKPQTDSKRAAVLQQLALYLTGKDCQEARFESFGWGPSNVKVQATEAVQSDPTLVALAQQNAYATPQGQIHGSWWDIAKALGTASREAADAAGLQAALDAYQASMKALFQMSDAEKNAFGVIGKFEGCNWDNDVAMVESPAGTWTAEIEFAVGDEFKVRQGKAWDVEFGKDGVPKGANIVIEEAGTYRIVLVYIKDGTSTLTVTKL